VKVWQVAVVALALWFALPRYRMRAISLLLVLFLIGVG
jgi:hypothetical protein